MEDIDVDGEGPQDSFSVIETEDYFQRLYKPNEDPKNYVQLMMEVNMSTDFRHRRIVNSDGIHIIDFTTVPKMVGCFCQESLLVFQPSHLFVCSIEYKQS